MSISVNSELNHYRVKIIVQALKWKQKDFNWDSCTWKFRVLIIPVAYIPDYSGNDFFMCLFLRYMADIMDSPELIRNVVFCGQLHHGKVGLCCMAE